MMMMKMKKEEVRAVMPNAARLAAHPHAYRTPRASN